MSDIVIKVEGIGKSYWIGHKSNERYVALRDVVANKAKGLWSKIRGSENRMRKDIEEFWALKDVSFEVKQGDRIGIIGRNGAGKSTLLKVLSRITEPTTGRVSIKGRVASLLEVGTGFHPELTGRENIYLNGAILGMTRAEIKRKFDEIVDFAEVEKFLDTPVKRFSSGMYVRLAFAVAAHLEPEILVVDEVLAVGDAQFQKKCMGKMEEVGKKGRAVLFVSHNLDAIVSLCSKCILLADGKSVLFDKVSDAIDTYAAKRLTVENPVRFENVRSSGDKRGARLLELGVYDVKGLPSNSFLMWDGMSIVVDVLIENVNIKWQISLAVFDKSQRVVSILNSEWNNSNLNLEIGRNRIKATVPKVDLFPGTYSLTVMVRQEGLSSTHKIENALTFEVREPQVERGFLNISKYSTGSQVWINHVWQRMEGPSL